MAGLVEGSATARFVASLWPSMSGCSDIPVPVAVDRCGGLHQRMQTTSCWRLGDGRALGCWIEQSFDHGLGALFESRGRISALQDEGEPAVTEFVGEPGHYPGHFPVALPAEIHRGQGIVSVRIEAAGNQNHFGSEAPNDGDQNSMGQAHVLPITTARRQRQVDGGA